MKNVRSLEEVTEKFTEELKEYIKTGLLFANRFNNIRCYFSIVIEDKPRDCILDMEFDFKHPHNPRVDVCSLKFLTDKEMQDNVGFSVDEDGIGHFDKQRKVRYF